MQAREVLGSEEGIGKRLKTALGYAGRAEETVLQAVADPLEASIRVEERAEAKAEAEKERPGLTLYTDGSRMQSGATGYSVVWKKAMQWVGIKSHMGYSQEAFDAECAAIARALEVAARRQIPPAKVTIFTDAQAAIRRMVSEEPGPGQKYGIQARKWIKVLRKARPEIEVEIRWCPAHEGIAGNEMADEWAKLAAEEPDAHGVEWLSHSDRYGRRPMPPPRSLANLKRGSSEKKWAEARQWAEGRITARKYRLPTDQRVERVVAGSPKKLAARFYQLKTGHCRTGQYLKWSKSRTSAKCGWCPCEVQTREHLFKNCRRWKLQQKTLWAEVRRDTGRGKNRFKIRDLFADDRCTRPILSFLRATRVGREVGDGEDGKRKRGERAERVQNDRREEGVVHGEQGGE
jgi:ribonuclease HI